MLYFLVNNAGKMIDIRSDFPGNGTLYINRNDFLAFEEAAARADEATKLTGKLHIATDAGRWTSPQFDVIAAPAVGDKVSQSFNGDSYPRGTIVKVSKTLKKVTTDTGHTFYRRGNTGSWVINGYASMIAGHVSEQNPSF